MTKDELTALEVLQNDKNIVIKQADKGGAFVVMDKEYYIDKINDLLKDSGTYKTLSENGDEKVMAKLKKCVNQHKSILTKKEIDYLTKFEFKTSNFYGLPKVHQSSRIKESVMEMKTEYIECSCPEDLKMRPIVGGQSALPNDLVTL